MANIKEIVTKAVIGKSKKSSEDKKEIILDTNIDNVLGCWVINHKFNGEKKDNTILVSGNYDINIWYSYDNNTKTNVIVKNFTYEENVNVKLKNEEVLTDQNEILVRNLSAPQVSDVKVEGNTINLVVSKELGVEIVGDVKVRVNVEDIVDDYDEETENDTNIDINENYLKSVNQN